jgi:hypothetical protein
LKAGVEFPGSFECGLRSIGVVGSVITLTSTLSVETRDLLFLCSEERAHLRASTDHLQQASIMSDSQIQPAMIRFIGDTPNGTAYGHSDGTLNNTMELGSLVEESHLLPPSRLVLMSTD